MPFQRARARDGDSSLISISYHIARHSWNLYKDAFEQTAADFTRKMRYLTTCHHACHILEWLLMICDISALARRGSNAHFRCRDVRAYFYDGALLHYDMGGLNGSPQVRHGSDRFSDGGGSGTHQRSDAHTLSNRAT
mgnify:CR=1 FL=1